MGIAPGTAPPIPARLLTALAARTAAAGLVGYNIVDALLKRNHKVRTLVRSIEKGRKHLPEACELVQRDVMKAIDVIFDMVAQSSYRKCLRALKPKGRYLIANPRLCDMLWSVLTSALTEKKAFFGFAGEKKEELLALKAMIEEGRIKPVVDKTYRLEQAAEAHLRVEAEQRLGPVVISMG